MCELNKGWVWLLNLDSSWFFRLSFSIFFLFFFLLISRFSNFLIFSFPTLKPVPLFLYSSLLFFSFLLLSISNFLPSYGPLSLDRSAAGRFPFSFLLLALCGLTSSLCPIHLRASHLSRLCAGQWHGFFQLSISNLPVSSFGARPTHLIGVIGLIDMWPEQLKSFLWKFSFLLPSFLTEICFDSLRANKGCATRWANFLRHPGTLTCCSWIWGYFCLPILTHCPFDPWPVSASHSVPST